MALPKRAITILRQVKAAILAQPKLYNQADFPRVEARSDCNTPCCLAGWVEWVANPDPKAYEAKLAERSQFGTDTMAETLGISLKQAALLFVDWPDEGSSPAWTKPGTPEAAKSAAKFIDRFIRNGGKW